MASKLALGLVIGGAVSSTVGAAFKTVEGRIKKLEEQGNKAKVLKNTIGETMRLRDEWKKAHDTGAASADGLLRKLEGNLSALQKQGIQVYKLRQEYQALGKVARGAELKALGYTQIQQGKEGLKSGIGQAVAGVGMVAIPTKISGDYQAQIRQMALWAHTAGTDAEKQMADKISEVAAKKGMGQQALAKAVGGLIEKGIEWEESVDYSPLIADLVDGQGMEAETIATLFSAFKEAGVKKEEMGAMLGQVAAAGDIGAFGPKDMAKYMPSLLGTIKTLGMEGPEAVRFLGASLQSQYKQTQDAAAAATNMDNLLSAIISSTSQDRFAKEGIDLVGSLAENTRNGKADNPVDAFIKLSDVLLKRQDPSRAKEVDALKKRIRESSDGSAEEAQAMASLLESAGLVGIVSDKSASAGLLAQIKYGRTIKEDMTTIKETDGQAKIEQDANKARETSNAKWSMVKSSMEASMTRIGDALRPLTDGVADGLAKVGYALAGLADKYPPVIAGFTAVAAGLSALGLAVNAFKIGKGMLNVARGSLMGNPNVIQRVFVTNAGGLGGGGSDYDLDGGKDKKGGKGGKGGRAGSTGRLGRVGQALRNVFSRRGVGLVAKGAASIGSTALKGIGSLFKGLAPAIKGVGLLSVLGSGLKVADTYQNAKTRDEKAEGYGGAAGGLAGSLVGAKMGLAAGAALGSVVPGLGTAIGGAIGAAIGGTVGYFGGDALGSYAGKAMFGSDDSLKRMPAAGPLMMVNAGKDIPPVLGDIAKSFKTGQTPPVMGQVVRSMGSAAPSVAVPAMLKAPEPAKQVPKVDQQFAFSPNLQVTVQGDVKDPAQLAREVEPYMRRMFDEYSRQAAARQLSDEPHV
ncbi:phage tail tape measure protein [Pseudomonas protegens]|uniref:phage tail tape measure protein n=1 Tax=Pseudomonas protegens TaxID=380021 RepID=UPI000F4AB586|nr:phage tail tape measure protein [Pseudomonas protegens]ROL86565.1 hypothetical protein BK639_28615 [Pseudomonas protegens]ROL95099.1 hypothetical protein BK640_28820 [Pseudomonas protegens]ROL97914.1 hypothetical protein BK641_27280 [Pseudomonas protegens]ROM07700.1 hypothetical protein BK642_14180 [Pseudomonas protegens]